MRKRSSLVHRTIWRYRSSTGTGSTQTTCSATPATPSMLRTHSLRSMLRTHSLPSMTTTTTRLASAQLRARTRLAALAGLSFVQYDLQLQLQQYAGPQWDGGGTGDIIVGHEVRATGAPSRAVSIPQAAAPPTRRRHAPGHPPSPRMQITATLRRPRSEPRPRSWPNAPPNPLNTSYSSNTARRSSNRSSRWNSTCHRPSPCLFRGSCTARSLPNAPRAARTQWPSTAGITQEQDERMDSAGGGASDTLGVTFNAGVLEARCVCRRRTSAWTQR